MTISGWYRSLLIVLLTIGVSGTSLAAFNFSDVEEVADNKRQAGGGVTSLGEGEGAGFYMAIYEDTVRTPNKKVEENIKQRFGIDFRVDLQLPPTSGPILFTDFFQDPFASSYKGTAQPTIKQSLEADCVRIKAAQADQVSRKWQLIRKRLNERENAMSEGRIEVPQVATDQEVVDQEVLNRLIGLVDEEGERRLQQAVANIPELEDLDEQEALIQCYQEFSQEVDFELKLQSILNPTRRQIEVLYTFMNTRLDDFADTGTLYGDAFPRYDLLFDIDVIDFIVFGTPVATNVGQPGRVVGAIPSPGDLRSYDEVEARAQPVLIDTDGDGVPDTPVQGERAGEDGEPISPLPGLEEPEHGGFGSSSAQFAGPFCADDLEGVELNLRELEEGEEAGGDGPSLAELRGLGGDDESPATAPVPVAEPPQGEGEPSVQLTGEEDSGEGLFQAGLNSQALCEGTIGVDFGNEFLRLLFCINVSFEKTGKSWETTRDENCIACHLYRMNEVFEEYVLASSVRPHKNTGTIMESAVCEDGYGDDIGFHFFLEWIPVKLFPDICYPEGGVTSDDNFAEMVGYPEIVQRVNKPGFFIECDADFKDEDAQQRCAEALQGNQLTYENFRQAYLSTINLEQPIEDIDDVDRNNVWAKLVGDQGIAERELHLHLYRLGLDSPWFQEEDQVPQDYKNRLDALKDRMEAIQQDRTSPESLKLAQLLCVKGYYLAEQAGREAGFNCNEEDTFSKLEGEIVSERNRVMRIVQRWNTRSKDFNKENPSCGSFSGSGLVDAFWKDFEDKFDPGYYLPTDSRKTQSTEQQVTGQIISNADIDDFEGIFSQVQEEVARIAEAQRRQEQQDTFETDQERGLQVFTALGAELASFRANMQAFTGWWSEMVDEKEFLSKGGERINVLDSYFEKLR